MTRAKPAGHAKSGVGTDLGFVREAAQSMRRMQADESFDDEGVRTIWHRGRQGVELLSWENRNEEIIRQELSIFGMVVEFRRERPLRTGKLRQDEDITSSGRPLSKEIAFSDGPDETILEYASHLLRHIKDRDFYAQHLLKEVNAAIASGGFDSLRTGVGTIGMFSRQGQKLPTLSRGSPPGVPSTPYGRFVLYSAVAALAGIAGAALLSYVFGLF